MSTRDLLLHAWTWRPAVAAALAIAFGAHLARLRLASPLRTLALCGADTRGLMYAALDAADIERLFQPLG